MSFSETQRARRATPGPEPDAAAPGDGGGDAPAAPPGRPRPWWLQPEGGEPSPRAGRLFPAGSGLFAGGGLPARTAAGGLASLLYPAGTGRRRPAAPHPPGAGRDGDPLETAPAGKEGTPAGPAPPGEGAAAEGSPAPEARPAPGQAAPAPVPGPAPAGEPSGGGTASPPGPGTAAGGDGAGAGQAAAEPPLPPLPGFSAPRLDPDGLVTVSIFGQSYRIRTDDPDLVFRLARRVLGAVREVMGRDPGRPAASGADALIQATFRLAMRLHSAEREAGALRAQSEALESRIERLLDLLGRDP